MTWRAYYDKTKLAVASSTGLAVSLCPKQWFSFVLGLLLIGVVLVLWGLFGSRRKKGKQEEIPALTDELETHYEKTV